MSSDKTLFAISTASFSPDPAAPLMSFLETAGDEGVPQYYEGGVERSPPSSSGPPSTRPPSSLFSPSPSEHAHHNLISHHASYAITTTSGIKSASDKSVDAWRRRQTSEPEDEEEDDNTAAAPRQPATSLSDQFSGMLHIEEEENNESTRVRFEDMTDAEIAQRHFRLAQQHLRAAQRLALAAASAPPVTHSSSASSAPSSLSSASAASSSAASIARVRHAQEQFVADLQRQERERTATSWTEPPLDVVESGWNRPVAAAGEHQQRRKQQQQQQKSGDSYVTTTSSERRSPSSSSVSAAPPTAVTLPSAPPAPPPPTTTTTATHIHGARPLATRFESSASSLTVRSAPLDGGSATTTPKPQQQQQRPVPPPRRATFGSADSKAGLRRAVTPSLSTSTTAVDSYSSEDPHAASGIRSISPSIYDGETDSTLHEQATAAASVPTRVGPPTHSLPLKVNYEEGEEGEEEEEEKEGQSPDWDDDDDDSRSDFYGAESVVSHVTRATLPEYEDALASMPSLPPPVPAIPSRFLPPLQTRGVNTHKSAAATSSLDPPPLRSAAREEDEQDFHGFRPRQTLANYPETTMHRMQPAQSAIRPAHVHSPPFSNLQPHAYVLSPTGQPIPIYSAAAFSAPAAIGGTASPLAPTSAATPARSNTLPVHAQPLRFEHSVPYSAPYVNSTVEVTYPNRKVSAATPALTSRPSTGSLSQMYHHHPHPLPPSRPQSSWSDTSSGADRDDVETRSLAAGSTFSRTKNRISSSLRAARVPHVRFMSPDPTVLRAPRGGSARQAPKTGVRRSASVTAPSSSDSQSLVTPEQDADEGDRRQRAMQMSLGMLI